MLKLDLKPEPRILRQFAYVAVVGLPLLTGLILRLCGCWAWTHPAMLVAVGVALLQLAVFAAGNTSLTRWLFVGLTIIALPIGFVLSHVLMATIYYLVITPIGLAFRLTGRDVMGRKLNPKQASFWHDRGPKRAPSSYFKLY